MTEPELPTLESSDSDSDDITTLASSKCHVSHQDLAYWAKGEEVLSTLTTHANTMTRLLNNQTCRDTFMDGNALAQFQARFENESSDEHTLFDCEHEEDESEMDSDDEYERRLFSDDESEASTLSPDSGDDSISKGKDSDDESAERSLSSGMEPPRIVPLVPSATEAIDTRLLGS